MEQPPSKTIMKIQIKHIIILLAVMAGLHIFANLTGMYETRVCSILILMHGDFIL